MKLPAFAIASSLAAGIFAGGSIAEPSPRILLVCFGSIFASLVLSLLLYVMRRETTAWLVALLAWSLLGAGAVLLGPLQVPHHHVNRAIAAGTLDLTQPLRWRGRLRSDPLELPWGTRYEVDLSEVQSAGVWTKVQGGLRANCFSNERPPQDFALGASSSLPNDAAASGAQPESQAEVQVEAQPGAELEVKPEVQPKAQPGSQAELQSDSQRGPRPKPELATPPLRAGESVELLLRAGVARNFANPGSFDYRAFLARQNIALSGTLRNTSLITRTEAPLPSMAERLPRIRGRLLREIDTMLRGKPAHAAVARAMLLGDRSFLDSEQLETFQATGVYHVLVLAGLHVGILAAAFLWAGKKLRLNLLARTLLTIAFLAAYVTIVEDRPPILRAVLNGHRIPVGQNAFSPHSDSQCRRLGCGGNSDRAAL